MKVPLKLTYTKIVLVPEEFMFLDQEDLERKSCAGRDQPYKGVLINAGGINLQDIQPYAS